MRVLRFVVLQNADGTRVDFEQQELGAVLNAPITLNVADRTKRDIVEKTYRFTGIVVNRVLGRGDARLYVEAA